MNTESNPVVLVTGAGSGIGRAIAIELGATHAVIGVDLSVAGLDETLDSIQGDGGRCEVFTADVSDIAALQEAVRQGEAKLGTITDVVAAAGIGVRGTVESTSFDDWNLGLRVNLTGVFATAKATITSLKTSKGSFTAIASDAAHSGSQNYTPYTVSKHGVVGLVRSMALDFAPAGVRTNAICPGFIETPMAAKLFAESSESEIEMFRNSIPVGRFGEPEEVAFVVRHFVESTYANGTIYNLDGGSSAGAFEPQAAN